MGSKRGMNAGSLAQLRKPKPHGVFCKLSPGTSHKNELRVRRREPFPCCQDFAQYLRHGKDPRFKVAPLTLARPVRDCIPLKINIIPAEAAHFRKSRARVAQLQKVARPCSAGCRENLFVPVLPPPALRQFPQQLAPAAQISSQGISRME